MKGGRDGGKEEGVSERRPLCSVFDAGREGAREEGRDRGREGKREG